MAAKYDKTLARLAEDRKAVTAEEAERDGEEAAVSRSREQASQAEAAAKSQQTKFEEQVSCASASVSAIARTVASYTVMQKQPATSKMYRACVWACVCL